MKSSRLDCYWNNNNNKKKQRSKKLLNQHGRESVHRKIFSKEKLFYSEQSYNTKNDVIYSETFDDIPENLRTVKRFQNQNSVWVAVLHYGKIASEIHG